jgi:PilZ domain
MVGFTTRQHISPWLRLYTRKICGMGVRPTIPMQTERRRTARFPFNAPAEILNRETGAVLNTKVNQLSLYGCYVEMADGLSPHTPVLIKIFTDDDYFESRATVIYVQPGQGLGLSFQNVGPLFLPTLQKWLLSALQAKQQMLTRD